jgi:hypothetical protein
VAALPRVQEWVGLLQQLLLVELEELPHDHPPSGKLFVERASGGAGGRFREERVRRRSVLFGVLEDGAPGVAMVRGIVLKIKPVRWFD